MLDKLFEIHGCTVDAAAATVLFFDIDHLQFANDSVHCGVVAVCTRFALGDGSSGSRRASSASLIIPLNQPLIVWLSSLARARSF